MVVCRKDELLGLSRAPTQRWWLCRVCGSDVIWFWKFKHSWTCFPAEMRLGRSAAMKANFYAALHADGP